LVSRQLSNTNETHPSRSQITSSVAPFGRETMSSMTACLAPATASHRFSVFGAVFLPVIRLAGSTAVSSAPVSISVSASALAAIHRAGRRHAWQRRRLGPAGDGRGLQRRLKIEIARELARDSIVKQATADLALGLASTI
jgi:hypothetical protein